MGRPASCRPCQECPTPCPGCANPIDVTVSVGAYDFNAALCPHGDPVDETFTATADPDVDGCEWVGGNGGPVYNGWRVSAIVRPRLSGSTVLEWEVATSWFYTQDPPGTNCGATESYRNGDPDVCSGTFTRFSGQTRAPATVTVTP